MPFTPAHSAIVLPFIRKRYFSATALIIGSVAPDFEYFFKMSVNGSIGHTLPGVVYFDIPITIALAFVFHQVVKARLIDNLPPFLQTRFSALRHFDFLACFRQHWFIFITSAALGALSHIFWDAFTHKTGFFVQILPIYHDTVVPFQGVRYPLFYALQHISTAIGLLVVIIYIANMPAEKMTPSMPSFKYWITVIAIIGVVLFLRFYWLPKTLTLGNFVVSSITAFCLALVVAGLSKFPKLNRKSWQ